MRSAKVHKAAQMHQVQILQDQTRQKTKQKIQAYLEEIDRQHQQQQQQSSTQQTKYIKFVNDKEHKLLSFTGKFDKVEVPAKDFETGQTIPDKYVERYSFECYDISDQDHPSELSVWQRGIREARTLLYFLSKNKQSWRSPVTVHLDQRQPHTRSIHH